MNKAVTDGIQFMPPEFSAGLTVWSNQDGTPGSTTWATAANGTLVSGDSDFGACLEIQKDADTVSLRYMGETPILPGCYLKVSARLKAISGNLPSARIAAWAGLNGGAHATGLTEAGVPTTLTAYGEVVEVSAIVGTGSRTGVDMPWGLAPSYGHFGLDLTGPNGGVVRVESIRIEDVTGYFLRDMMNWVDVRDYGAVGDGVTDCKPAFEAADADAAGRGVLVPEGVYLLGGPVTMTAPMRFEGTVSMAAGDVLALLENFDFPTYAKAFGDEELGLKKAIQALFNFTDHDELDLGGRRIALTAPLDVHATVGNVDSYSTRRVIRNGQLEPVAGAAWDPAVVTATASYSAAQPTTLTGVTSISQIAVGSLVEGVGVGREIYVTARDEVAGTLTLSGPLYGPAATQSYTFTRYRYMLDFSGFTSLSRFVLADVEFRCAGIASGVMLAPSGLIFGVRDCFFTSPRHRGITSIGTGCQGMLLDRNQFLSNEQALEAQNRSTIAFNVNANDTKIRDNRGVRFKHFAVMNGTGHLIQGNHFFQGDNGSAGLRTAGLVLTEPNPKTSVTSNYIDNCYIEWNNEHDEAPEQNNEFSFGALTIDGNIFTSDGSASWFRFVQVKPYGAGHFINGFNLTGNTFKHINGGALDRVDLADDSIAPLDTGRFRNINVNGNTFHAITAWVQNPVTIEFAVTGTAQAVWTVDLADHLIFGGRARNVVGLVPEGQIIGASGAAVTAQPWVRVEQGATKSQVEIHWPEPVTGKVLMTVRADNPL